jgi:hypothetical protein
VATIAERLVKSSVFSGGVVQQGERTRLLVLKMVLQQLLGDVRVWSGEHRRGVRHDSTAPFAALMVFMTCLIAEACSRNRGVSTLQVIAQQLL